MNFEQITLERIVDKDNFKEAFKKVVSNKGGAGVDDMETFELKNYIETHPYEISSSVLRGEYRPVESCVDDPNKARNNFGSTFLKSNPNLTPQKLKILS